MSSDSGIKGVLGGLVSIAVIGGIIYLKVMRGESRSERHAAREAKVEADVATWKSHALDMIQQVPDAKGLAEYLTWGVNTYHAQAEQEALDAFVSSGSAYRDILIGKIYERARTDGREDVTRSLDKVKTMAKLAPADAWWNIDPKKR